MARYATSEKASILHRGNPIPPKRLLSRIQIADLKSSGNWPEFVEHGWIVEVSDKEAKDYGPDPDLIPVKGNVDQTPGKSNVKPTELTGGKLPDSSSRVPSGSKAQVTGQWNKDPKTLKGKTLDELNTMIAEIDHEIEPAETIDIAIQILSADYVPPRK